jgi:hypothetical protein
VYASDARAVSAFVAKWRRLGLTDEDLQALEGMLVEDAASGTVIPGTGGLRKLRFAPPTWHAGKRGATRVIYAYLVAGQAVYFFTLYGKNEQSDLKPDEKRDFRRVLQRLQEVYRS